MIVRLWHGRVAARAPCELANQHRAATVESQKERREVQRIDRYVAKQEFRHEWGPTLERLQGKGLVKSERGEPTAERGGKARTYFTVTSAGIKELRSTYGTLYRLSAGLKELKAAAL